MHNWIILTMQVRLRLTSYNGDFVPARSVSVDSAP